MPNTGTWIASIPSSIRVVLSGMIGGLVFWVLMRITGVQPLGLNWYAGVPASLLFGGVAGFLGVYMLANSDTSQGPKIKHTFAFALVCGIVWSPVIDTAKQTVLSAVAAKNAGSAKDSAKALDHAVAGGSSAAVEQQIAKTAQTTSDAVMSLSSVTNFEVKRKVQSDSQDAVGALVGASQKAPDASVTALFKIGKEAAATGNPTVTKSVLDGLQRVQTMSPASAVKAQAARQEIITGLAAEERRKE